MSRGAKKMDSIQEAIASASVLRDLHFFKHFPDHLIDKLSRQVQIKTVSAGSVILTQGQINADLFILLSGILSVSVDDGVVARLDKRGDLVGEMSVITRQPVAATITAEVETQILILRGRDFQALEGTSSDGFQHALYRVYAHDLSSKLRVTNQKAKYFEDLTAKLTQAQNELREVNKGLELKVASRTLDLNKRTQDLEKSHQKLEQQNAELVASHKKMEELYFTRELTFQKLEDLYKNSLIPLQMTLLQIEQNSVEGSQQDLIKTASHELSDVLNLLEPVVSIYSSQKAMKSKRVLLAESNMKHQMLAKMALGGTGVELDIASNFEEGKAALSGKSYDILFVSAEMLQLCDLSQALNPSIQVVFMTSDRIDHYLPSLREHKVMPHIVSRDENDRTFTIKNIVTSVAKLASGDIFGVSKYLAWGSDLRTVGISGSDKRDQLIRDMSLHFEQLGIRRTVRDRAATALEEMLMNAIYDAPVGKDGKSLYNHLSRLETVSLSPEHQASLRYGTDGMILAIAVEDPFGSLDGGTILNYLDKCYGGVTTETGHDGTVPKGGGGRGLHQIIENSDLVVFNIHTGFRTEVIALFNVAPRDVTQKFPSFHLFSQ